MKNSENSIKVWDPFVRIFHWTLALAFIIAYVTEEDFLSIHSFAGYTIISLLLLLFFLEWPLVWVWEPLWSWCGVTLKSLAPELICWP